MNDGSFSIAILDDQNSPPTSGSDALDGSGTFEGLTGGVNVATERVIKFAGSLFVVFTKE